MTRTPTLSRRRATLRLLLLQGTLCASVGAAGLCALPGTASADELILPLRGDGFETAQTFYRTSGHVNYQCDATSTSECAHDIGATRWDASAGVWTSTPATPSNHPNPLANHLMWDQAVYAPFDGEIVSCWRGMPDDTLDGDDIRCPGGGENEAAGHSCARRGNHVVIRTTDGRLVSIAHLQEDTVPSALCPNNDTYLYTDDPVTCNFYDDARLASPISVSKGDFLGRVGTSGAGEGAHLHVGLSESFENGNGLVCVGSGLPMEFAETWYQPRLAAATDPTDWVPLQGQSLPLDGRDFLLWPDPVGPRTDALAIEPGSDPSVAMTKAGGVVAYRNGDGNLTTVAFGFDGDQDFDLGTPREEGGVDEVAVAKIGENSRHVVVAVENGSGNLQLIPYYVSQSDNLIRGTGLTSGGATQVAITGSPSHTGVVTAVRNAAGTLTVRDFTAQRTGTHVTVSGNNSATSNAGILRVAVDRIVAGRGLNENSGAFVGVVTAERRSDNRLILRTWSVSGSGNVTLEDTEFATWGGSPLLVDEVDVSVVGNGNREYVVATVRERNSDTLRVLSFQVTTSGTLGYLEGRSAGVIGPVASVTTGAGDVLVGVQDSGSDMVGASFAVRPNIGGSGGGAIRRTGSRQAGAISDIDVGARNTQRDAVFAVVDAFSEIRLIHYLTNYDVNE